VVELGQDDVFQVRGMTLDGVIGVSVLHYAREILGGSIAAEKHGNTLFKNGTNLGGVLKHPGSIGTEGQDTLRASLQKYRGSENAGKTLILEEAMDYVPLGMSQIDAEFINSRKLSIVELAMFLGVPPHILGFTEGNTSLGSSIEQQSAGFVNFGLNDHFEMWEGAIERDLLDDDALVAEFNDHKLMRGDTAARWAAHVSAVSYGLLSPDEIREEEGKPRRLGGDEFYPPPNMTENKTNSQAGEQNVD
jgi:HK97 family phage portal protein